MRKRILVVDDDTALRETIAELLEETYDVVQAEHGVAALTALDSGPFDAMLLDLMMPVMDGTEVLHELESRGVCMPVVVVSASPELAREMRSRYPVVRKPFDVTELENAIARAIG